MGPALPPVLEPRQDLRGQSLPRGRLVLPLDAWRRLPEPMRGRLDLLYNETPTKASPFAVAAWR